MKLNKSQWQLDFKSSIIIPCIIAITLITILLFIFPSIRYSALFSAQAENYSQNIIRQTNLGISQSLHQFETKVKNLIDDHEIRNFIISNESTDDFQYSFQNIIESYFQVNSLDAYYLEGLDLYLLHKKGSLHYGYKNTSLSDIQTSPYYRNALIYPTNLNWLPYNQKEECLELSMCIYNYTDYSLEGIVVIRLSQSFLLDKFQNLNIINADCMYILNENRQIICSTDISLLGNVFDGFELSTNACGSYSSAGKLYSYADMRSAVPAISYDKWVTVIQIDHNKLLSGFRQISTRFYILALLLILFSFISIYMFSRIITAPLYDLTKALKEIAHENFKFVLPETSFMKEYSLINHGFNKMSKKLDMLINTVYKVQLAQKEAQLKNLQSQMNPHFLFNTLQLISWKAYEYEAYPVCDMISSLSYMLQTDLYSNENKVYTLRDEMEYIKQYTLIIRCKYNNKIAIHTSIPEHLLDCIIPKLIIQPFLENSINHGLAPKPTPGVVSISVEQCDQDLLCIIEDDGVGIDNKVLQNIRSLDSPATSIDNPNKNGHHIALSNIKTRLELLYGKNYGFTITSQLSFGTRVELRIPYQTSIASKENTND